MNEPTKELRPQPGPQERFLKSNADIAFYGGSAGSGKSFGLLLEPLFDADNRAFRSVIFRRTVPMITQPGGLLDTSEQVYPLLGATLNRSSLEWTFQSGATVKLAGMELEKDKLGWQGSQLSLIAFDEVQEFSNTQVFFMFSRLRSTSGARSRMRASCNPDSESWLRTFLEWWIDQATGFPIPERSGVLRWFIRDGDAIVWGDSKEALEQEYGPDCGPKSCTFISARTTDNKILLEKDPAYLSNLRALPLVERARLLDGNWNIRPVAGNYFRREWFKIVDTSPSDIVARARGWDRAASVRRPGTNPDATAGVLLGRTARGLYVVEHVLKMFDTPFKVEEAMVNCAKSDPPGTTVCYQQDPGSAGVGEAKSTALALSGFDVRFATNTGSKESRAKPVSAQAEAGNVLVVRAPWNAEFFRILEGFPDVGHDDEADALSCAFDSLCAPRGITSASELGSGQPAIDQFTGLAVEMPVMDENFFGR